MRFFFLRDYQDWILGVFLGMLLAVLICLAFRSYGHSVERAGKRGEELFRYPDGIEGKNLPVPPFIILLGYGFIVWMIFYVIYIGMWGGPI